MRAAPTLTLTLNPRSGRGNYADALAAQGLSIRTTTQSDANSATNRPDHLMGSAGESMVQRFTGVQFDVDEAAVLLEVLDNAALVSQPSPRAQELMRRLRTLCGTLAVTAKRRALPADLQQLHAHDFLTAPEVALIIGCSTANVRYLRSRGHLQGRQVRNRWLYEAEPVVVYAERKAARRSG
jgi:hypothetical protein